MALYGFSVFCETPRNQRRGRRRYIVISFTIATLSSFSAALDNYWNFKCLLEASSPLEYPKMMAKYWRTWERLATLLSFAIVTFIGDALLVSSSRGSISVVDGCNCHTGSNSTPLGLSVLHYVETSLALYSATNPRVHRFCRCVFVHAVSTE